MNYHTDTENFESTYALIVRSEERERSAGEVAVYLLLILTTVFSIWRAALQPVIIPTSGIIHSATVVQTAAENSNV